MLAKKTSKNQVTLPKKALQEIPETDYFDVTTNGRVLILRPVTVSEPGSRLATVRQKIKDLGLNRRTWIVPSLGPESAEAAAGDPSRSRHERRRIRSPFLRTTIATCPSLAIRPTSTGAVGPNT